MTHKENILKILIVIPSFYPAVVYGGPIFSSLNTCKSLSDLGHDVRVATTNTNMYNRLKVATNKWLPLENIQVKYYNETKVDKFSLPLLVNLWNDIRKADLVHIQAVFNTPTPIALVYAWLFNKPVLLSPRGVLGDWIMNQGSSFKKKWLRFFIKPFANKITWHATAEQEKKEILNHFPDARVCVIPNGIDLKMYDVQPYMSKEAYCLKFTGKDITSQHIVVSMGRVHKKKGFDLLIQAFKRVKVQLSDAILFIAGQDEGELLQLKKQVVDLKLEEAVFFVGAIEGDLKRDFLVHADVFALTSHNENFGNVYAEALAAGVPIIASKQTPWSEVEVAQCGRWVNLDTAEIEEALLHLLNKDAINTRIVKLNAKEYIKKFSWESIGIKFSNEMETLVSNHYKK